MLYYTLTYDNTAGEVKPGKNDFEKNLTEE
jgi:hypothetical protein